MELKLAGTFPDNVPRFWKRTECEPFKAILVKFCKNRSGALFVYGDSGIGKTTIVAGAIKGLTPNDKAECDVHAIVWLNVGEMTSARRFDETSFYSLLLKTLSLVLNAQAMAIKADLKTVRSLITNAGKRILLILDGVNGPGIMRCVSHLNNDLIRCVAITNDRNKATLRNCPRFQYESFQVEKMSDNLLEEMFIELFKFKSRGLSHERIKRLVKICHGLPLIAVLIDAHFRSRKAESINGIFETLIRHFEKTGHQDKGFSEQLVVSKLIALSPDFESKVFRDRLYAFLLFPPGEPVNVADLAILWKCSHEEVVERCQDAFEGALLRSAGLIVNDKKESTCYIVHELLYKAAVEREISDTAEKNHGLDVLRKTIFETCLHIAGHNSLMEAIKCQRTKLLEMFITYKVEPEIITELCLGERSLITLAKNAIAKLWLRNEGLPKERCLSGEFFCRFANIVAECNFDRCINDFKTLKTSGEMTTFGIVTKSMSTEDSAGGRKKKSYENLFLQAARLGCDRLIEIFLSQRSITDQIQTSIDEQGNNALIISAQNGCAPAVKALVDSALLDVNARNSRGWTALMCCCSHANCLAVAKELKSAEHFDVNISDSNGDTALLLAVVNERNDLVKFLVDVCKADASWTNKAGWNALDEAANRGFTEAAKYLVAKGVGMGKTSLKQATDYVTRIGNTDLIALLTNQKEKILKNRRRIKKVEVPDVAATSPDQEGNKSNRMHELAELNQTDELLEILQTEQGREGIDLGDEEGNTALIIACFFNNVETASLLIENGASIDITNLEGCTALSFTSQNGHANVAKLLLSHGASVDVPNMRGSTPLISACEGGHFLVAKLLLENGASVDVQNLRGNTPLLAACSGDHVDIAELLLQHGASTDIQNTQGCTSLIHASSEGRLEVVKVLVEHGANLELQNEWGNTALISACQYGHFYVAKLLLENGASIDAQNQWGRTALMVASLHCHVELIKELLAAPEYGADPDVRDGEGKTALIWACEGSHIDAAEVLVGQSGADVDLETKTGRTALSIAKAKKNAALIQLLVKNGATEKGKSRYRCIIM